MRLKHYIFLPAFLLGALSANAASDPVVMTIDDVPVYKSEFEYVYNKNNSASTLDKKSVDEYLDLFINYKLKVLDAKEDGYTQQSGYIKEFKQYRDQLANPYIMDSESLSQLLNEAYERMKVQVACKHILIDYKSKDSVPPFVRISKIYDELKAGAKFEDLARKYSACPSGKNGGYLGYVDCFKMVYDFENEIYKLKPGQFSKPFKTRFGYHIAMVSDVRPNAWKKKTSQIFISPNTPNAESKIDSLLALLKKGADINQLSLKYSQSNFSGTADGRMPWVEKGDSKMPPEIVNAIMDMEKVGELKKTRSQLGWHIFRLDSTNLDIPFSVMKPEIERKIMQSDRASKVNALYVKGLYDKYAVSVQESSLAQFLPLVKESDDLDMKAEFAKLDAPLYVCADETYPQSDFFYTFEKERSVWHAVQSKHATEEQMREYGRLSSDSQFLNHAFTKFLEERLLEKSLDDLENSNADYRNLLNEYSDGLLLFAISNDKVWAVASKDRVGLEKYFQEHQSNYKWSEPRFRGKIFYCSTNKIKNKVDKFYSKYKGLPSDSLDRAVKNKFNKDPKKPNVSIKNGVFTKGQNKAVDFYVYKVGDQYQVERESLPEVLIYGNETVDPISYKEVRGAVVADYQNKLDADWVKELRQKHKVVVNQEVLKTIK